MQYKNLDKVKTKNIFLVTILVVLSVFLGIVYFSYNSNIKPANAQSIEELRERINRTNSEKQKIEEEIKQLESELLEVGADKDTLNNKIRSLEITQRKLQADINLTQKEIQETNLTISELRAEISEIENRIEQNYYSIGKNIRDINSMEDTTFIEILLTHNSFNDAWVEVDDRNQLQKALKANIEKLSSIKDVYITKKSNEESEKNELLNLQSELDDRRKVVSVNRNAQAELLRETENKESEYKKILEEKEEQYKKFEEELFEYESQLTYLLDPSKLPPTGTGSLKWPLDNIYITQRFGLTVDSQRLYRSGTHNGIDFRAARGTKVKAARSGTVTAIGNTDAQRGCLSYGKWILLEHDNGLSTLYAHLDVISVSPGEKVNTGEVIGYSGNTGYSTGPHLHLTVYASDSVRVQKYVTSNYCKEVDIPLANPKAYLDPLLYLPQ